MGHTGLLELHMTRNADRVRAHTPMSVQIKFDEDLVARIRHYADVDEMNDREAAISKRIMELEQESDMERVLEANAAALALTGVGLTALHRRYWLCLPAVVTGFLLQHALQGWCPPVSLFRRIGVRTRQEIDVERFALKVLRGDMDVDCDRDGADFDQAGGADRDAIRRALCVLAAVSR